ncbi:NucA/NucB deoxyribonuclease domain-containing protein [Paraburkholderia fungorum]|uniref:NucA/NucB deoxyribonuclease domain-containing protein n=1 Tax=Paraburkholderia fungorum TaxID=134537 RepID=UPI0038BCD24F
MMAEWMLRKPKFNDGSLPVLEVDYKVIPTIAEGIWHAQKVPASSGEIGWGKILTYDYVQGARERRAQRRVKRAGIETSGFERCELTADEYPFACTKENAGSTFLTNAPIEEQRIQGGQIAAFLRANGVFARTDGYFYFEVRVINYFYPGSATKTP